VWNLRPGSFSGYWNEAEREFYVYDGKIFLPDSHHRQQAIIKAIRLWKRLQRLSASQAYQYGRWRGDLFQKRNPLWAHIGIVKPGRDGKRLTVLNTGAARAECGRVLRQIVALSSIPERIEFLAKR
jgi:hypothetical protein